MCTNLALVTRSFPLLRNNLLILGEALWFVAVLQIQVRKLL